MGLEVVSFKSSSKKEETGTLLLKQVMLSRSVNISTKSTVKMIKSFRACYLDGGCWLSLFDHILSLVLRAFHSISFEKPCKRDSFTTKNDLSRRLEEFLIKKSLFGIVAVPRNVTSRFRRTNNRLFLIISSNKGGYNSEKSKFRASSTYSRAGTSASIV